jgi:hypothetical protein
MLSLGHLVLLGGLCETWDRRRFVRGLAGVVMLVGPGLWVGAPLLERLPMVAPAFFDSLRGASALNAACFALLVVLVLEREASRPVRTATLAIAAGMLLAVAHETWAVLHGSAGALLPHPLGHALGASLGLLAGVAGPRP